MSAPAQELLEVRLIGVPVQTWQRASAHQQAIQREFDILMSSLPDNSVPHRLLELSEKLANRFRDFGAAPFDQLRTAAEHGDDRADLVFRVPRATAEGVRQLDAMLDTVDEFCREGRDLLTLATPSDLVAFRRWFLGEFISQIESGDSPISWDSMNHGEMPSLSSPDGESGRRKAVDPMNDGRIVFEGDLDLTSAGFLRDEILKRRSAGSISLDLDLTKVAFIDSVGLSLLVTAFNRAKEEGAEMRITLPTHLKRVFEISGLIEVLDPRFEDRPTV